ncbi:chemotaxis protein CheY [Alkalihalobacillus pseudalcaliphilus]|nr:chemotaxis protein CheY [Alkalihalobacillus pseudalcaliphilus]
MRKVISDILQSDPYIEVVGTARNGKDALKKRDTLQPDVMTLDVEMPLLDGIETLKVIMATNPCPIIMLSSTTKEGAENTLLAMEYGAIDFVTKTSGSISLDLMTIKAEIIEKVKCAAKVTVLTSSSSMLAESSNESLLTPNKHWHKNNSNQRTWQKLVVIGTSTGGPRALKEVIPRLPKDFPHPILVVQHMPAGFTESLANRLNSLSQLTVKEASHLEELKAGHVYIAPGHCHLKVEQHQSLLRANLSQDSPIRGLRPAVDKLFYSLADVDIEEIIAVIMTGMGSDGTEGLFHLRKSKKVIALAQSEQTSVVFGMPKVAISSQLIEKVVDLPQIAHELISLA